MRLASSVACALIAVAQAAAPPPAPPPASEGSVTTTSAELREMFEQDQADRRPGMAAIDWQALGKRDAARLKRVKELYAAGSLRSGDDWFHAALILQHSQEADDYLLAHEMCVAALGKGQTNVLVLGLAAASEDRFLRSIGRRQRFGTQYESAGEPGKFRLAEVDPGVTDELRDAHNIDPLADTKASQKRFDHE
jgi:hypothetical protein